MGMTAPSNFGLDLIWRLCDKDGVQYEIIQEKSSFRADGYSETDNTNQDLEVLAY